MKKINDLNLKEINTLDILLIICRLPFINHQQDQGKLLRL